MDSSIEPEQVRGVLRYMMMSTSLRFYHAVFTNKRLLIVKSRSGMTKTVVGGAIGGAVGGAIGGAMDAKKIDELDLTDIERLRTSDPDNLSIPNEDIKGIELKRGMTSTDVWIHLSTGKILHYGNNNRSSYDEWLPVLTEVAPDKLIGGGIRTAGAPTPYEQEKMISKRKSRGKSTAIIAVGIILLLVGLVVAVIPPYKCAKDISDSWTGTTSSGYFKSYQEGSKAILVDDIAYEIPIDDIINDPVNSTWDEIVYYQHIKSEGYDHAFVLGSAYNLEFYSEGDIANPGDEVSLEITLNSIDVDGSPYWVWSARPVPKPNPMVFLGAVIALVLVGLILVVVGVKVRSSANRMNWA